MELYKRALSEAEDMGETALEAETVENPNCPMPTANCQPDISHLPAGIYFVRVSFENKMIVKKIVKL